MLQTGQKGAYLITISVFTFLLYNGIEPENEMEDTHKYMKARACVQLLT